MSEANEYELLYVVHARKPVDEVPAVIEWVSGLVTEAGGEVLSVDDWGRRRLAYPIDHELEGSYVLTTLTLPPEGPRGVEAQLVISEDIIRHLLTRGIIPSDRDLSVDEGSDPLVARDHTRHTAGRFLGGGEGRGLSCVHGRISCKQPWS